MERIVTFDGDLDEAHAEMAVTLTLADEIDVSRGDTLVREEASPHVGRSIEAMVVWMNERPMRSSSAYLLKHGTKLVAAEVHTIHERVDVNTLERRPARQLGLNDIGRVTLHASRALLFDAYAENHATGAFILIDRLTNATMGAGMILGPGADEPGPTAPRAPMAGSLSPSEGSASASAPRRCSSSAATRRGATSWPTPSSAASGTTATPRTCSARATSHAVRLCGELGLITLVLAGRAEDLAAARAELGREQMFEVPVARAKRGSRSTASSRGCASAG